MDYADTMSPAQGPPRAAEPAGPGAKPGTPFNPPPPRLPMEGSRGWEGGQCQVMGSLGWARRGQAGVERVLRGRLAVWKKGLRGYQKTRRGRKAGSLQQDAERGN